MSAISLCMGCCQVVSLTEHLWPRLGAWLSPLRVTINCTQKSVQGRLFVKGAMAARFGSRCTNIHCKTQLYFVPWIPVQIAEKKKSFLSSAGDSWNRKPGRLREYREPTLHPSAQGIFLKPQLIIVVQGENASPHTFILVEECVMDIESAFPPHAVASYSPYMNIIETLWRWLMKTLNVDPLQR